MGGQPVERLLYRTRQTGERIALEKDIAFYRRRRASRCATCGVIDPETHRRLHRRAAATRRLRKVLTEMTPEAVIDEVTRLGPARPRRRRLPHRASSGSSAAASPGDEKYLICNADEGDPGAFMDRSRPRGRPARGPRGHGSSAAYAIGAARGLHLRAAPSTRWRSSACAIAIAAGRASAASWATTSSAPASTSTSRSSMGAGAFVCGEETALIASIEGKRGMPRAAPAVPGGRRACGASRPSSTTSRPSPTSRWIMRNGADWYAAHRHRQEQGHQGLRARRQGRATPASSRCPMGITAARDHLRHRRRHPGRPAVQGRPDSAARPAAASRPSISTRRSTTSRSTELGSIMGSGGMIVMDDDDLHGRRRQVLHGLQPGRVVRQVRALPRRHASACSRSLDRIIARRGHARTTSSCSSSSATHHRRLALRARRQPPPTRCSPRSRYFRDEYDGPHPSRSAARPGVPAAHHVRHRRGRLHRLHALRQGLPHACDQRRAKQLHVIDSAALHQVRHLPSGLQVRRRQGTLGRRAGRGRRSIGS